jgi:hypothetical protein
VNLTGSAILALAALAAGFVVLKKVQKPGAGLLDAVNPTSRDNLAYSTVNEAGAKITGDPYWSLGGWIFDMTHPGTVAARDEPFRTPPYVPPQSIYVDNNGAVIGLPL